MQSSKIVSVFNRSSFGGPRLFHISAVKYTEDLQDPIKKLFLEKLNEYKQKSAGGKIVDITPEIEKELKVELERVNKKYGGDGNTDLTKFPEFNFPDIKIDPIVNEEESKK